MIDGFYYAYSFVVTSAYEAYFSGCHYEGYEIALRRQRLCRAGRQEAKRADRSSDRGNPSVTR